MLGTPPPLDDLGIDPQGYGDQLVPGPFGMRVTPRVFRVLHTVFVILMVALALWCLSMGCKVLPIFLQPFVDGLPDGIVKDGFSGFLYGCGVVHHYTWKLFVWMEPAAGTVWGWVVSVWERFVAWMDTLPG